VYCRPGGEHLEQALKTLAVIAGAGAVVGGAFLIKNGGFKKQECRIGAGLILFGAISIVLGII